MEIEILQDLRTESEDTQNRVALGIFKELSKTFENAQSDVDTISNFLPFIGYRSSYSIEDLPSNLIGFFRVMNGLSSQDICTLCGCWNKQSSLDRFEIDDESELLERWNYNFSPIELFRGGVWPVEFTTLNSIDAGIYWRVIDSTERSVIASIILQNERQVIMTIGNQGRTMPQPEIGRSSRERRVGAAWVVFDDEAVLMVAVENANARRLQFVMWVRTHLHSLAMQQIEEHQNGQIPTIRHGAVMSLPDQIPDAAVRR